MVGAEAMSSGGLVGANRLVGVEGREFRCHAGELAASGVALSGAAGFGILSFDVCDELPHRASALACSGVLRRNQ